MNSSDRVFFTTSLSQIKYLIAEFVNCNSNTNWNITANMFTCFMMTNFFYKSGDKSYHVICVIIIINFIFNYPYFSSIFNIERFISWLYNCNCLIKNSIFGKIIVILGRQIRKISLCIWIILFILRLVVSLNMKLKKKLNMAYR
jgi:hypothetical protein